MTFVRAHVLGFALVLAHATQGCTPRKTAEPVPPSVPLHLGRACELAPAAGLSWLVEVKPRTIAQNANLLGAVALVLPEARLDAFMKRHGDVDLRQVTDLCVARYERSSLSVALVPLAPDRVETAFRSSAEAPVTRTVIAPNPAVVRLVTPSVEGPRGLLVLGRAAAVLETGEPGPLRAAEAFAFGKLKKASPALEGAALRRASDLLGTEAEVRAFAAGPFDGDASRGLGGLLRAASAVGLSLRATGEGPNFAVRLVVTGAWGQSAPLAADRLHAALQVLALSPTGRLFGLNQAAAAPTVHVDGDALVAEATLDANILAKGVHDAVDADAAEIMRALPLGSTKTVNR